MPTLVTGATGFIGGRVVRLLAAQGRELRCLVEPGAPTDSLRELGAELVTGDIRDRDAVMQAMDGCNVVYHLAAIYKFWTRNESAIYEVNVEGSKTVLFAAQAHGVERVVFTSSIAAVGRPTVGDVADEATAFNQWRAANHYIRSKWLSERDALRFAEEGLPVVIVNPAFPFGIGDVGPTPTGRSIVEVLSGRVPVYLRGGINVVDVDDVAAGHVAAESKGRVGERYILGGHNVSHKDFLTRVARTGGLRPPLFRLPGPAALAAGWVSERIADRTGHEPFATYKTMALAQENIWFDSTKAQRELGLPKTPLAETISKSVRWFRENGYV